MNFWSIDLGFSPTIQILSIFKLSSVFGAWFARREVFYTRLDKNELKNMENAVRNDLFRHLLI